MGQESERFANRTTQEEGRTLSKIAFLEADIRTLARKLSNPRLSDRRRSTYLKEVRYLKASLKEERQHLNH